ncbi:MAG: DUF305 domain-containing protein [Actinomycetota bacterium]|nr:DUF305 domain-containing protein [Actinomycetota bacterium]
MQRRRLILVLCSLALLLLAVGCGEESPERKAERAFLSAMVPHHQSAIEMAEGAQGRLQDRRLREIQDSITETQAAEIRQMERIHERLFGEELQPNEGAHMQLGLSAKEAGMDHMDGMESLRRSPPPADRAFIAEMVPHHRGAVAMAQAVLRRSRDGELRKLAGEIVSSQQREIATMKKIGKRRS